MTLDNEQQRSMLLEIISKGQYPGAAVPIVHELIEAVQGAPIQIPNQPEKEAA